MSLETLQQKWLATMDMLVELNREKFRSPRASELLRHARSMINEASLNRAADEAFMVKVERLLEEAQREIFMAAQPLGDDFLLRWSDTFDRIEAGERYGEYSLSVSRFYPHLPRARRWVRIKQPSSLTPKRLLEISRSCNVKIKRHGRRHLVIVGDGDALKRALAEVAPYIKGER
ncbi:hypothetical protein [Candidatus Pyrohabitans sp.]